MGRHMFDRIIATKRVFLAGAVLRHGRVQVGENPPVEIGFIG